MKCLESRCMYSTRDRCKVSCSHDCSKCWHWPSAWFLQKLCWLKQLSFRGAPGRPQPTQLATLGIDALCHDVVLSPSSCPGLTGSGIEGDIRSSKCYRGAISTAKHAKTRIQNDPKLSKTWSAADSWSCRVFVELLVKLFFFGMIWGWILIWLYHFLTMFWKRWSDY